MLDYRNTQEILRMAEGKSTLKTAPVTFEEITIEVGQEIRIHMAGSYVVGKFEVIGFASARTWILYDDGDLSWYEGRSDADKQMPAVILKSKGWEQYKIMSARDAAGSIRTNRQFEQARNA